MKRAFTYTTATLAAFASVSTSVVTATDESERMVFRQDLTVAELRSMDKENMHSEWNDQFKAPASEVSAYHRLKQSGQEESVCPLSLEDDHRTNFYLFMYGYMQGLYPSERYPTSGCNRCEETALPFSQMVWGMSNVL